MLNLSKKLATSANVSSMRIERARLDMVHAELRVGTPERTSVTQVAAQWGFGLLGRFAAICRDSYGELPSETLRAHPH